MKLGKRLKQIESMVTSDYSHIWDCCCDHGLLGAALLERVAAPCIHFVDRVPEIISELEKKLQRFHSDVASSWQTHCIDVAVLPIDQYDGKHLIILAGVGGELITQLVSTIYQLHLTAQIDFLLCPVRHQFMLRQQLVNLDFGLQNEMLVEENQKIYEVLLVSSPANQDDMQPRVSPVGELIWQADTADQAKVTVKYLNKVIRHLQRLQRGNNADIQYVIDAYRSVKIRS